MHCECQVPFTCTCAMNEMQQRLDAKQKSVSALIECNGQLRKELESANAEVKRLCRCNTSLVADRNEMLHDLDYLREVYNGVFDEREALREQIGQQQREIERLREQPVLVNGHTVDRCNLLTKQLRASHDREQRLMSKLNAVQDALDS